MEELTIMIEPRAAFRAASAPSMPKSDAATRTKRNRKMEAMFT